MTQPPRSRPKKKWVMPKWMKEWRWSLADYGLGVEELMNDHDSNIQNNDYRALVIVGLKEQVALLTRLHEQEMLR